jgi:putative SOS response-associated peptidase YedK
MCGRYSLTANLEQLQGRFSFTGEDLELGPRYNVAPTQSVLVVTNNGEAKNRAEFMHWGLVPSWAKDMSIGNRMINARGETLAEKSSFRRALQKRRCLVLADGFYEWQGTGKSKTPMYVALKSREPFGMAGLWEAWKMPSGDWLHSCTIITTTPNSLMEPIHNRMPVILSREIEATWLDPELDDSTFLTNLLQPYPSDEMQTYPVSRLVNSPANDTPECIAPAEPQPLL